ncbi:DUF1073 domain-containing protein [Silvimonas soli]|uniref:DUF1073 domain-containing protein n=1 Tax=Silvimonas soli TaxID=2980100 RepID=UPI0024B321A4|nr:DUF1073 domain-containing protein [Silvimonas soli]
MARKPARIQKAAARSQDSKGKFQSRDSFQNLMARTGYGAGSLQDGSAYTFDYISRNRTLLEGAFQSNWVARTTVSVVAEDMTREGIEIKSSLEPDDLEMIYEEFDTLQLWDALCDNIKWARLYGGSIAVMLIDGQDMSKPLNVETIAEGQFKGLMVLDRWLVQPTLEDIVKQYGDGFGLPRFYDVVADSLALARQRIHHSRVIRIDGEDLPYWRKISENLWGVSVLEGLWDRIIAFDSTTEGAAQLVYKAYLRTYKVEGLRQIIAAGGKVMEGLVAQIEMIRKYQSSEGLTLMDKSDEFEAHSYTFSGLSDVLLQFGQQLSGATQIPLVRLFGQSPAGLNSTGESDLATYQDTIKRGQNRKLRTGLTKLLDVVSRSRLGKPLPAGTTFKFRPLYQLKDIDKANIAKTVSDAVINAEDAGIISRSTALKELRQSAETTGIFSNISDEEIEEAENDPPPPGETDDPANEGSQAQEQQSGKNAED